MRSLRHGVAEDGVTRNLFPARQPSDQDNTTGHVRLVLALVLSAAMIALGAAWLR